MSKVFIPKETEKAIAKAMTKSQVKAWKAGTPIRVSIKRNKWLHRWGSECELTIVRTKILENNLIDRAWSRDATEAACEAAYATRFFVYGRSDEFSVDVNIH